MNCLICNSENILTKNWVLNNHYNTQETFSLTECNFCGFHFIAPRPSVEYLNSFYNNLISERFYKHSDKEVLKYAAKFNNIIKQYSPTAKYILEIGCSTGYQLYGLKLLGYNVVGTELSSKAAMLANKWYDITVMTGEFPSEDYYNKFDVVIIHHVIEHVADPKYFTYKADKFLSKNGILMIETPNINSIGIKIFKVHYPVLCPPGHLNFFDTRTIRKILPDSHKILMCNSTSSNKHTFYNSLVSIMSILRIKGRMDSVLKNNGIAPSYNKDKRTNQKQEMLENLKKVTKLLQYLFSPFFYFIDRLNMGENILSVSLKNDNTTKNQ